MWVRIRGYGMWPARVCKEDEANDAVRSAKRGSQILLHTFGDHHYVWSNRSALRPFGDVSPPCTSFAKLAAVDEATAVARALGLTIPARKVTKPQPTNQWECGRCTLLNNRMARVCNACGTESSDAVLWACANCTLRNKPSARECSVCGAPRGSRLEQVEPSAAHTRQTVHPRFFFMEQMLALLKICAKSAHSLDGSPYGVITNFLR